MFNCCGCPSKNRQRSEDEEEEKEKEANENAAFVAEKLNPPANGISSPKKEAAAVVKSAEPVSNDEQVEKVVPTKKEVTLNVPDEEEAQDLTPRKSSLKKPKPRLSISTEVKIIPNNFEFEEDTVVSSPVEIIEPTPPETVVRDGSPLSDEVFAGQASDPPRPNLGVSLPSASTRGVDFPRPPLLGVDQACGIDTPMSPRVKVPTPHPVKRGSMPAVLPRWLSEEEDEGGGTHEPPVTPDCGKDELALRRHRFFSELLSAAQAATEQRPPTQLQTSKDSESCSKDLEALLDRLEKITARLEKTVPIIEEKLEPLTRNIVVTKSLEDLLDEHLTPIEKEKISNLISDKIVISPDSSADVEDLSDKELCAELSSDKEEHLRGKSPEKEPDSCGEDHVEVESSEKEPEEDLCDQPDSEVETDLVQTSDTTDFSLPPFDTALISESSDTSLPPPPPDSDIPSDSNGEDLSDKKDSDPSDQGSSESPDTVVCDVEILSEPEDFKELNMTNSQSTLSMSVQGFQDILQGPFASFLQLSSKIGGDVAEHAKIVEKAFQAQLQYLILASQCKKPSSAEEAQLLQPTSTNIQAIQEFREKHRTSPFFNHLSAISESIPALGWVTVSPAPSPFVKEMNDAGQFYTNRVLKDWKEKDKTHVEWTKAWVSTLGDLQGFVKQYHTTGLVWSGSGAVPARGGPPPPPGGPMPPPPPPLDLNIGDLDIGGGANDRSALFAEINRGTDVTKGLKKVTSEMQTHKNPNLRSGPAPFKAPTAVSTSAGRAGAPAAEKPPNFSRDGKKWLIEYQKGNNNLVVDGAEMNNVVYAFRCQESTITVKGKINSIFLDSCKKTAVVFDSVVSSVEFVNCQSVQMQVLGNVPTISIDKTDGCQMYLSDASLGVEVISSKSSEMNILVPKGNGDFTEFPVPEQFRTQVSKRGLTTTAVESTG